MSLRTVVSRATWLRGEGPDVSRLLRSSDQKMCCLGFACEQLGVKRDIMKDREAPFQLDDVSELFELFSDLDIDKAMVINDDESLTDADREADLRRLWEKAGGVLEFVD